MDEQDQLAEVVDTGDGAESAVEQWEKPLPEPKQKALELLVAGRSVAETAREVGVGRTTMFRWMRSDPHFQAAYNRWQHEAEASCYSRLLALMDKAVDAIDMSLVTGDAKVAMQLLKGMGMVKERPAGPTNAMEVLKRQIVDRQRRSNAMKREAMKVAGEEAELGF